MNVDCLDYLLVFALSTQQVPCQETSEACCIRGSCGCVDKLGSDAGCDGSCPGKLCTATNTSLLTMAVLDNFVLPDKMKSTLRFVRPTLGDNGRDNTICPWLRLFMAP